jgi:histidinol-phosphatase (PHP family)
MTGISDFHVHPDYSIDAEGSVEEYCLRASEIGLRAICFTTHYDSNPRRIEADGYWKSNGKRIRLSDNVLQEYIDSVRKAGDRYSASGLKVLCGLEIDYYPGVESEVRRLRNEFSIDFAIGSVHCLDNIAISDPREAEAYFAAKSVSEMADDYFELLSMAASCRGLDCLGHLDYHLRFGRQYYGPDLDTIEPERYGPVFDILLESGIGLEVNCSPYRRGQKDFHPSEKIIDMAIGKAVIISSVGSDCHKPADLARGVPEAYKMLERRKISPVFPVRTE